VAVRRLPLARSAGKHLRRSMAVVGLDITWSIATVGLRNGRELAANCKSCGEIFAVGHDDTTQQLLPSIQ
jgi:hypothetical protein